MSISLICVVMHPSVGPSQEGEHLNHSQTNGNNYSIIPFSSFSFSSSVGLHVAAFLPSPIRRSWKFPPA